MSDNAADPVTTGGQARSGRRGITAVELASMTPAERQAATDARTVTERSELSADVAAQVLAGDDEILARLAQRRARAS